MDKLAQTKRFIKYQRGNLKENDFSDLEDYISKLIKFIEEDVYTKITERMNWILDRINDDGWTYFGGKNVTGSARIGLSGTDWVCQHYIAGTYTERLKSSP